VVITLACVRQAHPPVMDKLVNEEKAPRADAVVVALEIVGTAEKAEDVGEETSGPLGSAPFPYDGGET
jgi:hypothetical protein